MAKAKCYQLTSLRAFGGWLAEKGRAKQVFRRQPGSETTAMCYGEFFPNPGPICVMAMKR